MFQSSSINAAKVTKFAYLWRNFKYMKIPVWKIIYAAAAVGFSVLILKGIVPGIVGLVAVIVYYVIDSFTKKHKKEKPVVIIIKNERPHMTGGVHEVIDETHKEKANFKETVQGHADE